MGQQGRSFVQAGWQRPGDGRGALLVAGRAARAGKKHPVRVAGLGSHAVARLPVHRQKRRPGAPCLVAIRPEAPQGVIKRVAQAIPGLTVPAFIIAAVVATVVTVVITVTVIIVAGGAGMTARGTAAAAAPGVAAAPGIMAAAGIAATAPVRGAGVGLGLIDAEQDRRGIEQAVATRPARKERRLLRRLSSEGADDSVFIMPSCPRAGQVKVS